MVRRQIWQTDELLLTEEAKLFGGPGFGEERIDVAGRPWLLGIDAGHASTLDRCDLGRP
jgi:hypothetical protein